MLFMGNTTIRILLCFSLSITFPGLSFSYDDLRQAFYQPPRINTFLPQFNRQFEPQVQPSYFNQLSFSMMPELNLSVFSARRPKFEVQDLGASLWTYNQLSFSFDDNRRVEFFSSSIQTPQGSPISLEMSKFNYGEKRDSPTGFRMIYQDQNGTTLWRERNNQSSIMNTSYNSYRVAADRWDRIRKFESADTSLNVTRTPPPTKELVVSFDERWRLSSPDPNILKGPFEFQLSIDSMEYDSNRWLSQYSGTLDRGNSVISFEVKAPRDDHGNIQSLQIQISGKGAPTVQVNWTPSQATNQNKAFGLLRESLPIPLLVGPRSAFRLNEVDMAEAIIRKRQPRKGYRKAKT